MTIENIQSDDPRLTAFVLDELDATERAKVEVAIERSPEVRAAVAELGETIGLVQNAMSHEPAAALTGQQRLAIAAAAGQPTGQGRSEPAASPPADARRAFRGRYVAVATCVSAAAALALVLTVPALMNQEQSNAERFPETANASNEHSLGLTAEHSSPAGKAVAKDEWWNEREPIHSIATPVHPAAAAGMDATGRPETAYVFPRGPQGRNVTNPTPFQGGAQQRESLSEFQQSSPGYGGYGLPAPQNGQAQAGGTRQPGEYGAEYGTAPSDPISGGGGYGSGALGNQPMSPAEPRLQRSDDLPIAERSYAERSYAAGERARPVTTKPLDPATRTDPSRLAGTQVFERSGERQAAGASPQAGGQSATPSPADSTVPGIDGLAVESLITSTTRFPIQRMPPGDGSGQAPTPAGLGTEQYNPVVENDFITPAGQAALSTFSIDVDTASYSNVRRFLTHGQFPPPDAVRIEELLNYFRYDYPQPEANSPFSVTTEIGVCPWNSDHRLARIGLKGREIAKDQRPPSNLVFLVDVSGSMRDENKLPLVQQGLEMLVGEMTEDDRVAIVTYAGDAGIKLPSTSGDRRDDILSVIRGLSAGGSTNGEAGIHLAYTQAIQYFIDNGTNRVILCTDGDFNVGVSDDNELVRMIQDKARQSGVFLSIFGFGMGNLKDAKLEQLANKGNGQYAYVDSPREARKVFVEEMAGSLYTIAKDVKIQVEFNPARVGAYRLIGYENRVLAARDFNDDTKDAGEIGAGHTVTALYELIPADKLPPADGEPLKYQPRNTEDAAARPDADASPESFTVKLRFKRPDEDHSTLVEFPVADHSDRSASPSRDFDWAASVAAFGLILRNSAHKGQADFELVRELALGARGSDESGLRREFIDLVYKAKSLQAQQLGQPVPAPEALPDDEARTKAAVDGKYRKLLKRLHVPQDFQSYGPFNDFGHWAGTAYAGESNLPQGHWVYVYPHWYIWGETHNPQPAGQSSGQR